MITRQFDLFLNKGVAIAPTINVNQYDRNEQWVFTLYQENGSVYTPLNSAIAGVKSDKKGIINSASVNSNGQVIVVETEQMTAAAGTAIYELVIDDGTHGTANFIVQVEPKPTDGAEISDSDYSYIQDSIDYIAEAGASVGGIRTQVEANTNAIESERTARQASDNTLQSNINAEASTRASADSNLQSQINQIVAPSGEAPSAAEVQNARIGADGATYDTLGNAIRGQVGDLKSAINQNIGRYGQNSFTTVIGSAHSQVNDDVKISLTTGETYYFEFTTSDALTLIQLVETDSSNNTSTQSSFSPAQGTTKKTYTAKRNTVKVGVYVASQSVSANVSYNVYTKDGKIFDEINELSNELTSDISDLENAQEVINNIINESFVLTPAVDTLEIEVTKTNGYMPPDGHIASSTQYAYTQKIPVREDDVIQLRNDDNGTPNTYMRYIAAFNGDTAIEAKGSNSNTRSYTVPADINFVVITFDQQAYPNVTVTNLASLYTLVRNAENPVVKKVTSVYDVPEIIVPEKSFAVVGHEWNMYYDNISNKLTDGYYLFCSGINGKSFDRLLRFTPTAGDIGTHTITVGVYAKNLKDVITSKDFDLIVVADSAPTKNVMFIGDSLTEEGTYINEIQNVLSNGSITSIGTRTETTTPGYSNIHHEGRSGWSAYNLTEKASEGTTTNAFWNPTSGEFDFSYYVNTSYPAAVGSAFPGVDCVMLNLGTNGTNNVKRTCDAISEMITSIHEYDSSIKIIVSLITPPTTQDGCGQHNGMFNANQWKIYELNLIKAYLKLYQDVSANVYVSEPYFNIDRLYDFPTKTVAVSSRNPLQITINDNDVHPRIYGYLKIADVYYANLLYRLS